VFDYFIFFWTIDKIFTTKKFKNLEYLCFKNFKNVSNFYNSAFDVRPHYYNNFKHLKYLKLINSSEIFYKIGNYNIDNDEIYSPIHIYYSKNQYYKMSHELHNRIHTMTLDNVDFLCFNYITYFKNLKTLILVTDHKKHKNLILCKIFAEQIFNPDNNIKIKLSTNLKEIELHKFNYAKTINILAFYNIIIKQCNYCTLTGRNK